VLATAGLFGGRVVLRTIAPVENTANGADAAAPAPGGAQSTWRVVDTGQTQCYDDLGVPGCPAAGQPCYGQDAQYAGVPFGFEAAANGRVVHDRQTGLTWTRHMMRDECDVRSRARFTHDEASAFVERLNVQGYGGFRDWRIPSIKELYSLIHFQGHSRRGTAYLDTAVFEFQFGDEVETASPAGAPRPPHPIDAQFWSSTPYAGLTFGDNPTVFGVNFADGRIKGYPAGPGPDGVPPPAQLMLRLVRGPAYGINRFEDRGDGTVADVASGLMWTREDSGAPMSWPDALAYAEACTCAGYNDWRLPNAKELQSIVDYTRAPDAADAGRRGPAIDPVFRVSSPGSEPWYWTSTTHVEAHLPGEPEGTFAVYVSFGRAIGRPHGATLDVHGAGAQRSDPKRPPAAEDQPVTLGPQADELRGTNYVRCVRTIVTRPPASSGQRAPHARP